MVPSMSVGADEGSSRSGNGDHRRRRQRTLIHSPYKIKVGERLAYWALAQTYGRKGFQYSGPVYKTYRIQGNAVEIDFEYGEEGLTPENQNVKGFEIVGSDGIFRPAKAEVINGTSTVKYGMILLVPRQKSATASGIICRGNYAIMPGFRLLLSGSLSKRNRP